MKKITITIFTLFALAFMASNLFAEDKPAPAPAVAAPAVGAPPPAAQAVTGSASMGVFSKYIFRGYALSKDSIVVQPAATVSYYGFSLGFWSNIDSKQRSTRTATDQSGAFAPLSGEGEQRFNETDITLSYTYNIDKLALTGGFVYYGTSYTKETEELFLSIGYDVITKPVLSVYRDVRTYPGTYYNLAFSHSLNVTKEITFDLGASAGYYSINDEAGRTYNTTTGNYDGKRYSAFHDGMLKAGFTIPIGKFSIQPVVQYWFPLSSDAKKTINVANVPFSYNPAGSLKSTAVVGLTATLNF